MEQQKQNLPRIDSDWFVGFYTYVLVYSLYTPRKSANDWSPNIVKFEPVAYCKVPSFKHFKRCLVGAFSLKCKQTKILTEVIMAENNSLIYILSCRQRQQTQTLLNGTWPSYFDIDFKRIQMLKVDVASFSSCHLIAIITDSLWISKTFVRYTQYSRVG